MPMVGDTKTTTEYISKAELQKKISFAKITDYVVEKAAVAIGAAIGGKVKGVLGAIGGALGSDLGKDALTTAIKSQSTTLKGYLKKVKDNDAKGIKVTQTSRYSYMSGSGTAWHRSSNPKITTY
ncbi:hypothetical protein A2U94_19685 [Bacillus sp. VT 712]|uniref:Uncharacterized protein n=1 Tax=Priestia veravalensis TaxID=1414648 RepID=A0A0V8JAN2_9BACI|nr:MULTISPECIES: hypothetical protein [Bacillaceae]KSU83988.1 hypothetical protein AS180_21080 [Priestia veravalensis]KZB89779.1 hypothetical protein A2U94_19685 [Bacillus sp. VT 712]SCC59730.1 hypothetical protein GA0061087_11254 [Priestia flexa]